MGDYGTMSAQERHEQLWQEVATLRIQLSDMQRRAERAEATSASMIQALRGVLPVGFRGDNPVWACEKIADLIADMTGTIEWYRNESGIATSVIRSLHDAIESQAEETAKLVRENDFLRGWLRGELTLTDADIDEALKALS